jgi:ElaB/YqjD/DUF883 family membrane-anchored ribosome-binding protein
MKKGVADIVSGDSAAAAARGAYERSLHAVKEAGQTLSSGAKEARRSVAAYVDKHPFTSLGIAAAIGFVVSAMIRR